MHAKSSGKNDQREKTHRNVCNENMKKTSSQRWRAWDAVCTRSEGIQKEKWFGYYKFGNCA